MLLTDFLKPEAIISSLRADSKKQVLKRLAEKSAKLTGLAKEEIIDTVMKREKLGSTALGNGAAIPHEKFPRLDKIYGIFAKLDHAIEFESFDEHPVDLVFLLLVPEKAGADHLKALSCIARVFRNKDRIDKIRHCHSAEAIYELLVHAKS